MALTTLQGSDWTDDNHWTGIGPADGDSAYISAGLGEDIDGFTENNVDCALIRIPEGYRFSMGASGDFCEIAAAKLEHYGQGPLFFSGLSLSDEDINDTEIACANSGVLTQLTSEAGNPADFLRIFLRRGRVEILSALAFENSSGHVIVGKVDTDSDVDLTIAAGADTLPRLDQDSGVCRSDRTITAASVGGQATLIQGTAAIATLDVCAGATAILNHGGDAATATIATTVRVHAGATLDLTQNNKLKTITTLFMFPGSTVIYDGGLHVFTTSYDWRNLRP